VTSVTPAPVWLRAAAVGVDLAVAFISSLVLSPTLGIFFAERAVVTLRIGEAGTLWQGPIPLMLGIFGEIVYLLPFVLFAVWALEPLAGTTIGARLVRVRVVRLDQRPLSRWTRWGRTLCLTIACWGWTLGLLTAFWPIAFVATIAGLVVWSGTLLALDRSRLTFHDRITRTTVVRG
jgi:uncharacterized RDD family membrane protein YckC